MKLRSPLLVLIVFLGSVQSSHGYDNPHFYRATNLFFEPRYDRPWLSSFDISFGTGSTECAFNRCSQKVPLLDIYGIHNMQELGVNVPCKDPSNPLDLILMQLALTPGRGTFAHFSFSGSFDIKEVIFSWIQNYARGFFMQAYVPLRKLSIDDICPYDLSPCDDACPNINTPIWQAFKNNFKNILHRYGLCCTPVDERGIGDATFLFGWTHSYGNSDVIDYVDATVRVGVITPTSKQQDINNPFSLPLGYNGHVGFPFIFDFGFGTRGWLSGAFHVSAIAFTSKERDVRIQTSPNQSGLFKLSTARVDEQLGTIWTIGAFLKGDHCFRQLSVLAGYSFVNQNNNSFSAICGTKCQPQTINCDESLFGWKMHTMHFAAEFDLTERNCSWGPRFTFFYNQLGFRGRTTNSVCTKIKIIMVR